MQRESSRREWLRRANQCSTLIVKKDDDGLSSQCKENLENAEVDPKTVTPDGVNAPISKSSQHVQNGRMAKTCRETQYRELYLRVKEDYEKLSTSYIKLKQSHAISKNALYRQEMHINDLLYQIRKKVVNRDATALENTYQPEAPRSSSLNLLLSSFSHPTSEASRPSLSPLTEPHKADQTLNRGTGTGDAAVKKLYKDHYQPGDPADQAARKLVPLQELQATQGLTNFTQKLTARECLSENDSDEPIVISERSLKRKRPGNKQHNASNAGKDTCVSNQTLTNPVRVKSEPELSSPHSTPAHHSLVKPNDSIDLDDVGDRTVTPRKRRRVWACLYGEEDISRTGKDEGGIRLLAEAAAQTKYPRSPNGRVGHHSRTPDSPLKGRLFNQDRICDSETTSVHTRRNVLGVMDPNRRMLPNVKDHSLSQQCAIQIPQTSHGLPSRDGCHPITESKWSAKGAAILRDRDREMTAERPNLPPLSSHFETERKHERTLSAMEALEPPVVSRLYPEDFTLNPQHNQGLNYAYSEVIRGQHARRCLNGCTRPDCCGTLLRKAVEIGGYIAPPKPRLSNAINNVNENDAEEDQDQDQDQDQQLLDEYLGHIKHRLKALPESQRKELLLQAKTENFAKLYGKHRTSAGGGGGGGVYGGRPSTPPGFWNADMPTTQEEIENRKCANEMERRKVEQMYREAMRPNGRYLLR